MDLKNFFKENMIILVIIIVLITVISVALIAVVTVIGKEPEVVKKKAVVEEELPYEKVEDLDEEKFNSLLLEVRDQIMVFDIEEVHNNIYPTIKSEVNNKLTEDEIEEQIRNIVEPFMEEWTLNRIRVYLGDKLGAISEDDVERYRDRLSNDTVVDFIIVYEKKFLQGDN